MSIDADVARSGATRRQLEQSAARGAGGWLKALRWQRLPEMEKLGDTLVNHFDGIAAWASARPIRSSRDVTRFLQVI